MMNDFNSLKADEAALSLLLGEFFYVVNEKASYASFEYEGENNKYVLMLIEDHKHAFFSPAARELFNRMLEAMKLESRDIAIVNIASYPAVQFSDLKKFFTCSKLVLWGPDASKLGLTAMKYQPTMDGNVQILQSESMDVLLKSPEAKTQLWNALKNMFRI